MSALRGIAGGVARNTATLWKSVAEVVDPGSTASKAKPAAAAPVPPTADNESGFVGVEPGQMMVPIDTWTRILEQVGNVHEAGQQLAAATERAARAETENDFLREQLRDLKSQKKTVRRPAAPATPSATAATAAPVSGGASSREQAAERLTRARKRASRWLNPD